MTDSLAQQLPEIPTTVRAWKGLIDDIGVRPSKGKGQNFLFERGVVQRIVRSAKISPGDHVVEIGPGLGILTWELLSAGAKVTAIELDWRLAKHLETLFANISSFRLVEGDALNVDLEEVLPKEPFKIVANLPYSVAAAVIQRFLEAEHPPETMTVMVQKEVALRLMAPPPDMSILSVATQFFSKPAMAFTVPPGVFIPPPRVESAVISLRSVPPALDREQWPLFFRIVHAGFGQKRKNLANSLSHGLAIEKPETESWLRENQVDPMRRAETLTVAEWIALTNSADGFIQ